VTDGPLREAPMNRRVQGFVAGMTICMLGLILLGITRLDREESPGGPQTLPPQQAEAVQAGDAAEDRGAYVQVRELRPSGSGGRSRASHTALRRPATQDTAWIRTRGEANLWASNRKARSERGLEKRSRTAIRPDGNRMSAPEPLSPHEDAFTQVTRKGPRTEIIEPGVLQKEEAPPVQEKPRRGTAKSQPLRPKVRSDREEVRPPPVPVPPSTGDTEEEIEAPGSGEAAAAKSPPDAAAGDGSPESDASRKNQDEEIVEGEEIITEPNPE